MKTETLRRFVEVVYTENINKAAKNMNLPQQSLSKNMKSLENEFGVILFERTNRGIVLTQAGKDVYAFAKGCLKEYDLLIESFDEQKKEPDKCKIKIGAVSTAKQHVLPEVLINLYRNNPVLELEIIKDSQNNIIEMVRQKKIDMGIILQYNDHGEIYPSLSEDIEFTDLYASSPCYWVSRKNVLYNKRSLRFADLKGETLLSMADADKELMDFILKQHGLAAARVIFTDNVYYMSKMVEADLGIAQDLKTKGSSNLSDILSHEAKVIPLDSHEDYQIITGVIIHRDNIANTNLKYLKNLMLSL